MPSQNESLVLPDLKELIEKLTPEQQQQVLEFVRELHYSIEKDKDKTDRVPGLLKGKIFMSDDFDDPLEFY